MEKQKQQTRTAGFTIVEALVTLSILGIMIAILLMGVSAARDRFLVRDSAQRFANDLRNMFIATSNGVKLDDTCVPARETPRECSNYKMLVNAPVAGNYQTQVKSKTGTPFALLAGTQFSFSGAGSIISEFVFPGVSTSSSGGFDMKDKITTVEIKSARDNTIKTNVCVYPRGAVIVQSANCQ